MARNRRGIETLLTAQSRAWINRRWKWLIAEFGADRMTRCQVVQPLARYFPDRFDGTPEDAQKILARICTYIGLDVGSIEMEFYVDRNPVHADNLQQGTAGLYQEDSGSYRIWIEVGSLRDATSLISTLSHELAHIHLLGHGRVSSEENDQEKLTDLLTVFLGMGVFAANAVIHEQYWAEGLVSGWSIGRRGYLSMVEFGYALALFAHDRNENDPDWLQCLRPDVLDAYRKARAFVADPSANELEAETALSNEPMDEADALDDLDGDDENEVAITRDELLQRLANGDRNFRETCFREVDLSGLDLRECTFAGSDFDQTNLTDANLAGCDMRGADMQDAVLLRANLRGACLKDADLTAASLNGADLTEADICGADFTGAILDGTVLTGTQRDRTTNLVYADLTHVVCDQDIGREGFSGTSNLDVFMGGYSRFRSFVIVLFVVCFAATIGGLLGGVAGVLTDRLIGQERMGNSLAISGVTLGALWAIRMLIRRAKSKHTDG